VKSRLDKYLVDQGYCRSRSQAQELISAGLVELQQSAHWTKAVKPSQTLIIDTPIRIQENKLQNYVSRGALKLIGALDYSDLTISGMHVLDVGQSTGGFTQAALERGASSVTGIEVGHHQLAENLRSDSRVRVFEGINARELRQWFQDQINTESLDIANQLSGKTIRKFDLAVMDVSFISQTQILPGLPLVLKSGGYLVSLVKPQFEVGPKGLGKGGIVTNSALYNDVEIVITSTCKEAGLEVLHYFDSPIQGGDGNREFFIVARKLD